jgi:hypothetical protein
MMKELGKHYLRDVMLPALIVSILATPFIGFVLAFACTFGVAFVVTFIALIVER